MPPSRSGGATGDYFVRGRDSGEGGGIYNHRNGNLTLTRCTAGNNTTGNGGEGKFEFQFTPSDDAAFYRLQTK